MRNRSRQDNKVECQGSINAKPGEGGITALEHSAVVDMSQEAYLRFTATKSMVLRGGELQVQRKTIKQDTLNMKDRAADRSGQDWAMCCNFFEEFPGASIEDALVQVDTGFTKSHGKMQVYKMTTLRKAFDWKMCCRFFQEFPQESIQEALAHLDARFMNTQGKMQDYKMNTLKKASEHIRKDETAASSSKDVPSARPADDAALEAKEPESLKPDSLNPLVAAQESRG